MLSIVEETVKYAKESGHKKLGIMATTGNIKTELYQTMCKKFDMEYFVLDDERQQQVMEIIYDDIKSGKPADMNILKNDNNLGNDLYIDSLEVLARQTIIKSNRKVK